VALARAGVDGGGEPQPNYSNYAPAQQQVARLQQPAYGGYQQYPWPQPPPPELPKRDWRDWFIMATVMGGVGYGLYFVAKVGSSSLFNDTLLTRVIALRLPDNCTTYRTTVRAG
jgi:hypothetical protein